MQASRVALCAGQAGQPRHGAKRPMRREMGLVVLRADWTTTFPGGARADRRQEMVANASEGKRRGGDGVA